jgi:Protein of unknown function (DUF1460)
MYAKHIDLGRFTQDDLDKLIHKTSEIKDTGKRIDFLSRQFLHTDYSESTLIGDKNTPEVFVINLQGVDCLTFIEYVEAMRLSCSLSSFEMNLKKIRYKSGLVEFMNRNHFFTDWREFNSDFVHDITDEIGNEKLNIIQKTLNQREEGTYFLPGIQLILREIKYVPSDRIDKSVSDKLGTGDYAGIYSNKAGLDVSHVGIIIRDGDDIYLRHASSQDKYRKVIDQDFKKYIADKPGIIVLRPKIILPG